MKKITKLVLAAMFAALVFSCADGKKEPVVQETVKPAPQTLSGPKKRVGIFAFKNKSRYGQDRLTQAAVDILYSELEKSGLFELYERADLNELAKEYELIEAGNINPISAAEPGKLVGVQAVIIGSITQFGLWEEGKDYGVTKKKTEIAESTVDVRVVDVTTGKVITADSGTGRVERTMETTLGFGAKGGYDETMADKALRASIDKFIDNLIRRLDAMPWQGRVADVDNNASGQVIYVNAGQKSKMPMGAKLAVYKVAGKITDPDTGAFLGYKTSLIGQAEVFDFTGEDLSLARMTSGSGASKGDIVKLARDAGNY
jgi:curli biogenesis system outer membrane secretion channel CsgG